ncbi:hypothetical protein [Roseicella frigidaeris]|uniref:Uncharacterized protein n=1 Tax=Roseicella frigidaeris TaxID=2230885 RepID=A0A327M2T3_9PROT|nr:hypothetical protein [Roseicella frigidaeris]RAI57200.1 hypothetical protein DOO78_20385 [Roseicella frigidaeris]
MPFSPASFNALIQTSAFNLWHYRTSDSRAMVSADGYFAPVADSLQPGDLMVLQTSDAMAIVPLRSNDTLGPGVTLDGTVGPVSLLRASAQGFRFGQAASAVVRTILLAPIAAGILVGGSIPVSARVAGPIGQVVFSVRQADGTLIPPAQLVTVQNGQAVASLAAPPTGSGYRIRVEDAADPAIAALSGSFSVAPDTGLLLDEAADGLLTESGNRLRR